MPAQLAVPVQFAIYGSNAENMSAVHTTLAVPSNISVLYIYAQECDYLAERNE